MNTVDYIRNCDNNQDRTDPNDSILKREFLGNAKVKICDVGQDIEKFGIPLNAKDCVLNFEDIHKGNIYCLSGIYTKHLVDNNEITEFNTKSFGESLIVISNPRKFIERVKKALLEAGYSDIKYGPITYYPNDYSGYIGPFMKHQIFSQQNEYRFYVPNDKNNPIIINIGPLDDIAIMQESCFLRFELTDNRIKTFMLI